MGRFPCSLISVFDEAAAILGAVTGVKAAALTAARLISAPEKLML